MAARRTSHVSAPSAAQKDTGWRRFRRWLTGFEQSGHLPRCVAVPEAADVAMARGRSRARR